MPTFNNSTFFPVLLPVHPPSLKGFWDLMPYKSQFAYNIVLTFIFLYSLLLLQMCRSQGTHVKKHLVNMPGRCAFQNHFPTFPRWEILFIRPNQAQMLLPVWPSLSQAVGQPFSAATIFSLYLGHMHSQCAQYCPQKAKVRTKIILLMYKHRYTYNTLSDIQFIKYNNVCVWGGD